MSEVILTANQPDLGLLEHTNSERASRPSFTFHIKPGYAQKLSAIASLLEVSPKRLWERQFPKPEQSRFQYRRQQVPAGRQDGIPAGRGLRETRRHPSGLRRVDASKRALGLMLEGGPNVGHHNR